MAGEKNKEVGKHPPLKSTEESFGSRCGTIAIGGGEFIAFGHKPNPGVWPTNVVSVDVKTGYPRDFDKGKKAPKV
jgi:hypothetical protein